MKYQHFTCDRADMSVSAPAMFQDILFPVRKQGFPDLCAVSVPVRTAVNRNDEFPVIIPHRTFSFPSRVL